MYAVYVISFGHMGAQHFRRIYRFLKKLVEIGGNSPTLEN